MARTVVLVLTAAALSVPTGALVPSPASAQDHPPGILPEGDWTDEQAQTLLGMVADAERELPAFGDDNGMLDQQMLEQLGFVNFGATAPGGWDHWINPGGFDDDHILDPRYPESLVFRSTEEGWVLEAAMYFLGTDDTMDTIPEEIAWLPGWHAHPELCWDENFQFASCGGGGERITIPMMHVWITDNPCGHRFAGVDSGGVICGDHHHEPGPDPDPDPDPGDPGHPGHEDPNGNGGNGKGHGNGGHGQGDGNGHDGGAGVTPVRTPSPAPAAPPVLGQPNFTG